ncbi:MAG: hypothetical protein PUK59_00885 [Actinomycetaceae bacterium]|nr:hypothetical protein [Actinomycetaceae bacterium]MDY5854631.1 hypothetical protein [Arcanobacterium sp.]
MSTVLNVSARVAFVGDRANVRRHQVPSACRSVRLYWSVRLVVALALAFVLLTLAELPAFAAERDQINGWFSGQGRAVVVAQSAQAFPGISASERQQLAIGAPTNVMGITDAAGAVGTVQQSSYWVASISRSDGELLGVLVADFASGSAKNTAVIPDADLAQVVREQARGAQQDISLLYDQATKAWFSVDKAHVSAAGSAATRILAGTVPLQDFLAQRARNLGLVDGISGTSLSQVSGNTMPGAASGEASRMGVSPVGVVIVVLVIVALLTVSLLWLRWEAHHPQGRLLPDDEGGKFASDTGSFSIVEADGVQSVTRLDKASGKVRVFRRNLDTASSVSSDSQVTPDSQSSR